MDEEALISGLQTYFSTALSAPVRTGGMEDERPVPVVVIDDWDTRDKTFHNTARSGEATGDFDNDGSVEHEWYLTFDFQTRIELAIRHSDEVDVTSLKDSVVRQLRLLSENPLDFHSDLKRVTIGGSGNPTYKYTEPKEAELMASATFHGDHTITRKPSDTQTSQIQQVNDNFTFNP